MNHNDANWWGRGGGEGGNHGVSACNIYRFLQLLKTKGRIIFNFEFNRYKIIELLIVSDADTSYRNKFLIACKLENLK